MQSVLKIKQKLHRNLEHTVPTNPNFARRGKKWHDILQQQADLYNFILQQQADLKCSSMI